MEYEITDKGKKRLEKMEQKGGFFNSASKMTEWEILHWLDSSSEEGSGFIDRYKGTWRTDGVDRMRRAGLIDQLPRQESLFPEDV